MTDREMLEMAAKAAGLRILKDMSTGWLDVGPMNDYWNPLRDDGDAMRLAVKLGISIRIDNRAGFSWAKGFEGSSAHGADPYAATRRAIVRAAAAMAEQMEREQ